MVSGKWREPVPVQEGFLIQIFLRGNGKLRMCPAVAARMGHARSIGDPHTDELRSAEERCFIENSILLLKHFYTFERTLNHNRLAGISQLAQLLVYVQS